MDSSSGGGEGGRVLICDLVPHQPNTVCIRTVSIIHMYNAVCCSLLLCADDHWTRDNQAECTFISRQEKLVLLPTYTT